jgi:hypothetical protein
MYRTCKVVITGTISVLSPAAIWLTFRIAYWRLQHYAITVHILTMEQAALYLNLCNLALVVAASWSRADLGYRIIRLPFFPCRIAAWPKGVLD